MLPDLSLVIPAYNEERRLPSTLDRLAAFAREERLRLELILGDDGSRDGSVAAFEGWATTTGAEGVTTKAVTIAHRGKGAAVRAAMDAVTAPVVGYCDADLSAGPDAIVALRRSIDAGADMAMASRGLPESVLPVRQPWYRERAGRTFNVGLRLITGLKFKDTQCGLKLFRAACARDVFARQRLDGFAFDLELVLLAKHLGYRIDEVPIRWSHADGSKVAMGRDSLRMARDAWAVARRAKTGRIFVPGVPVPSAMSAMLQSERTHWWDIAKRRLVLDALGPGLTPRRILDLGAGGGAMLADASSLGETIGLDLSTAAAAALTRQRLKGVVADVAAVPLTDASVTHAIVLDVLEHHRRPELALAEVKRVLQPGGRLIVTVPAFQSMWSDMDDALAHYRRYAAWQLRQELEAAGFVVERLTYVHAWLLPLAWIYRVLLRRSNSSATLVDERRRVTWGAPLFAWLTRLERGWLAKRPLPFGLTVLAVAVKPTDPSASGRP